MFYSCNSNIFSCLKVIWHLSICSGLNFIFFFQSKGKIYFVETHWEAATPSSNPQPQQFMFENQPGGKCKYFSGRFSWKYFLHFPETLSQDSAATESNSFLKKQQKTPKKLNSSEPKCQFSLFMDRWTPGDSICVNGVLQLIENSFVNYIYYWYDMIWYEFYYLSNHWDQLETNSWRWPGQSHHFCHPVSDLRFLQPNFPKLISGNRGRGQSISIP